MSVSIPPEALVKARLGLFSLLALPLLSFDNSRVNFKPCLISIDEPSLRCEIKLSVSNDRQHSFAIWNNFPQRSVKIPT